jgi:hypothetical protein
LSPTAFGYSIDNSGTFISGSTPYDVDHAKQGIANGTHTIHFKSWTSNGACPVVNTTFSVGGSSSGSTPSTPSAPGSVLGSIPSYAVGSGNLDGVRAWDSEHDKGTPGSSRGSTVYPATTPLYDDARKFYMTYSNHGGERWHLAFATNATATHFVLDTYVYLLNPDQVQNLELDLNQVMSNGSTVIFGTQCSSISKTWEFTVTAGGSHWRRSNIGCNPRTWSAKTWHHIQIGYHRSTSGVVTHDWVNLDGTHHVFTNTTFNGAEKLGWQRGTLLLNIQIDGNNKSSGSVTAYIHKLTVYHW